MDRGRPGQRRGPLPFGAPGWPGPPTPSPGGTASNSTSRCAARFGPGWNEPAWRWVRPRRTGSSVEGSRLSSDELMDEALREADHRRSGPLSSREFEVADLVAGGLTNREIVERLFISPSTVESHVEHIKAKLGFARRARIVAWALDRASDTGSRG